MLAANLQWNFLSATSQVLRHLVRLLMQEQQGLRGMRASSPVDAQDDVPLVLHLALKEVLDLLVQWAVHGRKAWQIDQLSLEVMNYTAAGAGKRNEVPTFQQAQLYNVNTEGLRFTIHISRTSK